MNSSISTCLMSTLLLIVAAALVDAEDFIPRRQDKMPGPAVPAAEAAKKMTVPDGFTVEVVASEPDIVNPVGMTIDERGRFWITESFEYPRREPGPGRDRVKVLEDTDGDGKADKFTVFAEGLNIPSGIAVGYGGVWVANAPDILFMQDTDGDGKADKKEVIVTGFGRDDTHELPNSLTWGPDGYLYGLNGVFNFSHVRYPKSSPHYRADHPGWKFTCALFRIHPITKKFDVFCEGTSNPWGVAFDNEGSAFISACVIDHLWHLTRTGYYHRQGGPYPPHTWKIESIVKHKHQAAAYCGIHYFDSDAYPAQYREKLFMGNIHGGCINVDKLERDGSSYFATGEPDFLTANDVWFMPVVQKTGPDGSLYILDWYDRYHCYQDANRDPKGIDRLNGRLYRVRYQDTPRTQPFDLAKLNNLELLALLRKENDYYRWTAQRIITERITTDPKQGPPLLSAMKSVALVGNNPRKAQMHALWASTSLEQPDEAYLLKLLSHSDAALRAWGVRTVGNFGSSEAVWSKVRLLATDVSPDVQLQVAIAAGTNPNEHTISTLLHVLENCGDDKLIPQIVWQNLHPLLEKQSQQFIDQVVKQNLTKSRNVMGLLPRAMDRIIASKEAPIEVVGGMVSALLATSGTGDFKEAKAGLQTLSQRIQSRELQGERLDTVKKILAPKLSECMQNAKHPLHFDALLIAASWQDPLALEPLYNFARNAGQDDAQREQAINVLAAANDTRLLQLLRYATRSASSDNNRIRGSMLTALARLDSPDVAPLILETYPALADEVKPRAIEALTQRATSGKALLSAVAEKKIPATAINVNQAQKLLSLNDSELTDLLTKHWGTVRTGRDPARQKILDDMRALLEKTPGDPARGQLVYNKVCGQCHKLHGQGQDVGPDITANGRSNYDQLLSNVFDPSLVIGASYQARTVLTSDGRVITGLLAEDTPERIVLKVQGGKLETIARGDIEMLKVSELSLMPEQLEKQLKPEELADLFSLLTLDKPPGDASAKRIPGAPNVGKK